MWQRQWQLSLHCDHRLQYHCRFHLHQTLCATGLPGGSRSVAVSVALLWLSCGTLVLWHSFLPPAFFSGRSLGTSWAWRQPLTLVRCFLVCAFSNSVLVSCATPPFTFFALWTQLKEHSADSGTNLSHRVTHLHGCRRKPLQVVKYLLITIWFAQYRRG